MSERESRLHTSFRANRAFYLAFGPFLLVFLAFSAFPMVFSLYLGFNRWDGFGAPTFIGLRNYTRVLSDPVFQKAVWNTAHIWFWSTTATVGLALVLAVLVNEYVAVGRSYFRMVFLVPLLVAPAVSAIILRVFFSANNGLVNLAVGAATGTPSFFDWLNDTGWIKPLVVMLIVWRWTGWHMIIFLAGLQAIPRDIYEAARMEGVGRFAVISRITLPLLIPAIGFSLMTATLGGLQIFDEPYVLTLGTGGTNNSATTIAMYLYATAFTQLNFGLASAVSWYLFATIVAMTFLFRTVQRRASSRVAA